MIEIEVSAPTGYLDCIATVGKAVAAYVEAHGHEGLLFLLPPADVTIIGPLIDPWISALGRNETTRAFLRELDAASNHEATIAIAIMVLADQVVGKAEVEGDGPTETPWADLLASGRGHWLGSGGRS